MAVCHNSQSAHYGTPTYLLTVQTPRLDSLAYQRAVRTLGFQSVINNAECAFGTAGAALKEKQTSRKPLALDAKRLLRVFDAVPRKSKFSVT